MIDLLRSRRSIRSYASQPVDRAAQELLAEALLRSPTSRNIRPWEFILVDDRELLKKLSSSKEHGSSFLKGAPFAVVVCGDGTKSDVWVEDCSIASILVQMTAQSIGLGSCWIQIRERRHDATTTAEEHIRTVLGIPDHVRVESIIAIGHPAEKREPLPASELQYGKVHLNSYAQKFE